MLIAVDPMFELIAMRCIEVFAEAIPGVIIQIMAIKYESDTVTFAAWISLATSAGENGKNSKRLVERDDSDI